MQTYKFRTHCENPALRSDRIMHIIQSHHDSNNCHKIKNMLVITAVDIVTTKIKIIQKYMTNTNKDYVNARNLCLYLIRSLESYISYCK